MDMELEPRTKALAYKIKATSRESPAQKAANVFDPDLRTHWSTGTNTKEWILLELDLLSSNLEEGTAIEFQEARSPKEINPKLRIYKGF
ncbi:hypothetical protein C4D60_Mb05t14070 [Musa balbisiana]|uniref:DNA-repair protein Xrcc1 N-terminal domain-containing protein n=1 Tax=Musa balbisiana TaxID=52838 RepID=A0A4S8JW05_MUSBA|nr:hypothetical protein C4D60_Mb05t14070 [Musa balbisiana]